MGAMPQPGHISDQPIRFGVFELDPRSGELRRNGSKVRLQEQPLQILLALVENPGRMVSREDLRKRIWPADTFVDFDRGLYSALARLRDALGDSAENPRFIETIPRRGYQFIAPVEMSSTTSTDTPGSLAPSPSLERTPGQPQPVAPEKSRQRSHVVQISVVIVAGLLAALGSLILRRSRSSQAEVAQIRSLAVLPLTNLSSDPEQDYFSDGLTEALTNDLGKFSVLRVISRTSTIQYKNTKKTVPEIARDLNVDAVIEGTVLRSGNNVRITVNLIQAYPEKHLWAETYETEAGDILNVQAAVALSVAREIHITLTPSERSLLNSRTVNPAAQDLHFRGMYAWNSGTAEGTKNAVGYFQRAIESDPSYADAYVGLALAYAVWLPGLSGPQENMPKAREAALKALALDETLSMGHSVLGSIELYFDWNWAGAEKEFKRALELDPNDYHTHNEYARLLVVVGRTDEALTHVRTAMSLDPFLPSDYVIWITYLARRYDKALELAKTKSGLDPNNPWYHFDLALVYEQTGRPTESVEEYLKFETLSGTEPQTITRLRQAYEKSGPGGFWKRRLQEYRKAAKSQYFSNGMIAQACVRVGEKECALESLEKAFRERDDLMINLNVDPVFDGIRTDPHFRDLVRRVGLPDAMPQT
jgi:TolB-like protein/DNA-binding winged helix-turn-helix (wHTH) protein